LRITGLKTIDNTATSSGAPVRRYQFGLQQDRAQGHAELPADRHHDAGAQRLEA
jgi:hypothetical protein